MVSKKKQKTLEEGMEKKTPSTCCDESCCGGQDATGQKSMLGFFAVVLLLVNLVVGFFIYKEVVSVPQKVETELSYLMQMGGDLGLYREFKSVATQMTDKEAVKKQLEAMKKQLEAKSKTDAASNEATQQKQTATTPPKADRPVADLFIMSYCPFGLQAQKAYLEVMEKLGSVADINVKFVHYLMHGAEERDENTRQRCIQKDQKSKYIAYAKCFLEAGKSAECIKKANIDEVQLQGCMDLMNQRYKIMEDFANGGQYPRYGVNAEESQKYGVMGSPTFVLNGVKIENIGRDAASYAKAICDSFTVKPEACNQTFGTTTFDPMFGWTSNGAAANANCGAN